MVGGKVVEVIQVDGRIFLNVQDTTYPKDRCGIYVVRDADSEKMEVGDRYEPSPDPIEQARRTVVRCFMGFGTTGMTKQGTGFRGRGERENSTGPNDFVNYPESLRSVVTRLKGVIIESRPAIDLIKAQDTDDTLFYCDPPYPSDTRSAFRSGRHYRHEMHDSDHRQLGQLLRHVRGMVVISGYHCDLYDNELFHDWKCVEKDTHADGGKKRVECLWLNAAAVEKLQI